MQLLRSLVSFITLLPPSFSAAQSYQGWFQVIDGDTIAIQGVHTRIRLYGIDAPEGRQTCLSTSGKKYLCGSRAADALQDLVGRNGYATCTQAGLDRYEHIVAICTVKDIDLGRELVLQGWAVEFPRYSDGRYAADEAEARRARRGFAAVGS